MASKFQQQARQRKLVYAALILVLFTAAWVWRRYSVDVQAADLAIREQSRGEVELSGSFIRLSLTGLRGVVTCVLWTEAMDRQKKNQWNELEIDVRMLAKLQPHFITPWLFQSWNLAYNVSVEADRINDRYFYITRGIGLLAEGERQNRDNPDLRWAIGFYNQHKISQSDDTNTLRSIYQLSCIPPNERDPARFWVIEGGRKKVNLERFEDFCRKHPQLVRRLNEGMRREVASDQRRQFTCQTPEDVVRFLEDNQRVPSVYHDVPPAAVGAWQEKPDRPRDPLDSDRFPVLAPPTEDPQDPKKYRSVPPQRLFEKDNYIKTLTSEKTLRDSDDPFLVSQGWYAYAQEPIPLPDKLPGSTQPIEDRARQRKPRYMMTVIFRQYPAQAARYSAERCQEEGWFDESGWDTPRWFPDAAGNPEGRSVKVGTEKPWSRDAWKDAADLWSRHGHNNHLLFEKGQDEVNMMQVVKKFREKYNLNEGAPVPRLPPEAREDKDTQEQLFFYEYVHDLYQYRSVSNFMHHYYHSEVEARPETVEARKLFDEAEMFRRKGSPTRALDRYEKALPMWRDKVLLGKGSKNYRRDSFTQEQTLEIEWKYLDLVDELDARLRYQRAQLALALVPMPGAGAAPVGFAGWLAPVIHKDWKSRLFVPPPFDGVDDEGVPLISQETLNTVLQRHHLIAPKGPPPGMTPGAAGGMQRPPAADR
jgi:hypothetical protein